MSAWSDVFELERWLDLLVAAAWAFTAAAVATWIGVFLVRARRLHQLRRQARTEAELTDIVLALVAADTPEATPLLARPPADRPVLEEVLLQLIAETKGRDHDRLLEIARQVGFPREAVSELAFRFSKRRTRACVWLSHFADPAALAVLRHAMDDRDADVRFAAARALLQHDAVPDLRWLLEKLAPSPDDPPLALADLFHRLPASRQAEAVTLLTSELPLRWRSMLAIELARNQVHAALLALRTMISSPEAAPRVAGWLALRELGDPRCAEWLPAAFIDPDTDVRIAACRCASVVGQPETMPLLWRLLGDADWWVRYHAARALAELGDAGRDLIRARGALAGDPANDVGLQVLREQAGGEPHAG
jgi:HEAT repeat protein